MYKIKYRKSEEMKDSGVEWLGEIPKEWEVKKLKYVAECYPSNVDKKTYLGQKTVKLCNYTDVYYNNYITSDIKFMKATASKAQISRYGLKKGDIVLTKDSESPDDIGVATYINENIEDLVCGYHLAMIRPYSEYNPHYLYFLLLTNRVKNYFATVANGITRYGIGISGFKDLMVCLPSDRQQKIANFLDIKTAEFNSIISTKEKLITKLEEAKKSLISEVVTGKVKIVDGQLVKRQPEEMKDSGVEWLGMIPKEWDITKLKHVANVKGRIGFRGYSKEDLVDEENGALAIGATQISKKGYIDLSSPTYINWKKYFESPEIMLQTEDILLVQRGSVGKVGIVEQLPKEATINPSVLIIKVNNKMLSKYIYYYLKSKFIESFFNSITSSTAIPMISQEQTLSIFMILPDLQIQQCIINFLNDKIKEIDYTIDKNKLQIQNLKQAKQSLISEAVTGKIDLRDWEIIGEGEVQ